jgi:hypothetical protein
VSGPQLIRQALPIKVAAADADHVLDLRKVCKQFGTDTAVDALIDVDLVLRRGEFRCWHFSDVAAALAKVCC